MPMWLQQLLTYRHPMARSSLPDVAAQLRRSRSRSPALAKFCVRSARAMSSTQSGALPSPFATAGRPRSARRRRRCSTATRSVAPAASRRSRSRLRRPRVRTSPRAASGWTRRRSRRAPFAMRRTPRNVVQSRSSATHSDGIERWASGSPEGARQVRRVTGTLRRRTETSEKHERRVRKSQSVRSSSHAARAACTTRVNRSIQLCETADGALEATRRGSVRRHDVVSSSVSVVNSPCHGLHASVVVVAFRMGGM